MTYNPTKPSIYPPYCFDAAPTYNVSSFLKITDVSGLQLYRNVPGKPPLLVCARLLMLTLTAHPGVHFYANLPVRWVRIVGVIVGIDDFPDKRVYTVDDSSGLNMQCMLLLEARQEFTSKDLAPGPLIPPEYSEFDVGHVVDLRGPIVPFRRQKAIKIRRMKPVPTTQHELLLWERRLKFKTEVLDVQWVLSDEEIRGYRRKAEQADAKDFNLAATKRKRGVQREDRQGDKGTGDDPFKVRKRVAKPASASSHKGAHPSGGPSNGTNVPAHDKSVRASLREGPSQPCGGKLDPYSIKTKKATRVALSAAPRTTPSRRSSIHDDSFKTTKQGSRRAFKVPIQSSVRPSGEAPLGHNNSPSCTSQSKSTPTTRASGHSRAQPPSVDHNPMGRAESPEPNLREKSKAQNVVLAGTADDPYVIKARCLRRALTEHTASERSTSADPFKITRSRKGPCADKSPNADPVRAAKRGYAPVKDLRISQRHGGCGTRFDADDPFKITKAAGR